MGIRLDLENSILGLVLKRGFVTISIGIENGAGT